MIDLTTMPAVRAKAKVRLGRGRNPPGLTTSVYFVPILVPPQDSGRYQVLDLIGGVSRQFENMPSVFT